MDMIVEDDLKVILPIKLDELAIETLPELLRKALIGDIGETYANTYPLHIDSVVGFLEREIHIRMRADPNNNDLQV
jgi:hypothetical protein